MKPGKPLLQSSRLLDQVRERIRYLHYSLNTEKVTVHWAREFVRWSGRGGHLIHQRELGARNRITLGSVIQFERSATRNTLHTSSPENPYPHCLFDRASANPLVSTFFQHAVYP